MRLIPETNSPALIKMGFGTPTQFADLEYGYEREKINQPRIENHLDCKLMKLGKFSTMDWIEVKEEGDESPAWNVEQKARKMDYQFLVDNYKAPKGGYPSALIGKNKIDYMKYNGGNGVVYFDFYDKLMYWVFDEDEYAKMEVEMKFVRNTRSDCVDKPSPVVHIPTDLLKEVA